MGDVPVYDPRPPPEPETFQLSNYELSIVKLTEDPKKKSWERFTIRLPSESRSRWLEDPTYGPEWRKLLDDFDHHFDPQFLGNHAPHPKGSFVERVIVHDRPITEKLFCRGTPAQYRSSVLNQLIKTSGRVQSQVCQIHGSWVHSRRGHRRGR